MKTWSSEVELLEDLGSLIDQSKRQFTAEDMLEKSHKSMERYEVINQALHEALAAYEELKGQNE